MNHNAKDQRIYESIFKNPPVDWKTAPLTPIFDECVKFFDEKNVTTVIDFGCGPGVWRSFDKHAPSAIVIVSV